ncbi:PaaX family transcriptional regulator C-terminal domain-containing protein [Antarctobacter jejuensis]|uniref:PaaX family transcriptional regulator C-terminal domain-containing protein n=1 Tax=Antarctobacter jejuensis TaxID=1439938 RepID=UPI003FD2C65F
MDDTTFDRVVADLRGEDAPRVWSLLVTVFGELAQDGSSISASVLSQITARIGIKPEAMRVALHRLRKDGWIESERRGRSSDYRLSPQGREETVKASPRIYGGAASEACWLVLSDPGGDGALCNRGVWVTSNIGILPALPEGAEVFATRIEDGADLPGWMRDRLCPPETLALACALGARLAQLTEALESAPDPDTLQQTVLRVLIVHEWRRIVLKMPLLPDHVWPEVWAAAGCRDKVARLLALLPRQDPEALNAALAA